MFVSCFPISEKPIRVNLITERDTGRSRGFAFVEMSKENAERAITGAQRPGTSAGVPLRINEALDRPRRGGGGGGGRRF